MTTFSGATKQSLANLLESATHSVIDGLYQRFEVDQMRSSATPNKLRKTTHLVEELSKRSSGSATLSSLVNYLSTGSLGAIYTRGSEAAEDFYDNFDRDLDPREREAASGPPRVPATPRVQRQFSRPGTTARPAEVKTEAKRYVFVVRGRDQAAYGALADFLRHLDLRIVTWREAALRAGGGTPSTLDIVRAGIGMADAVVVLMTPDDLGQVKPEFTDRTDGPREQELTGQARQNVIFEAGWAMALDQQAVVLVRVGEVRELSDIDGLNYVYLTGDIESRKSLISRLRGAGATVDDSGEEWRTAGDFPEHARR